MIRSALDVALVRAQQDVEKAAHHPHPALACRDVRFTKLCSRVVPKIAAAASAERRLSRCRGGRVRSMVFLNILQTNRNLISIRRHSPFLRYKNGFSTVG